MSKISKIQKNVKSRLHFDAPKDMHMRGFRDIMEFHSSRRIYTKSETLLTGFNLLHPVIMFTRHDIDSRKNR